MADDSNCDSWNEDKWKSKNKKVFKSSSLTEQLNQPPDFESTKINHLLNEIVCNRHSSQNRKSHKRELQLRRINSAIYAEPIESYCDDSVELSVALSNITIDGSSDVLFDTYCHHDSLIQSCISSSLITTINQSKSLTRVECRCQIDDTVQSLSCVSDEPKIMRYALNGRKVIHISNSCSNCTLSTGFNNDGIPLVRNRAHLAWMQKKKLEIIRKKKATKLDQMRRRIDEERLSCEKAERVRKEHETFLTWIERKKWENERKRKAIEEEIELEKRLKGIETDATLVKELHLQQWRRKKERIQKVRKQEQKFEERKRKEEKKNRLEESTIAFKLWCEMTKNRSKPATQGLLPHHQAKPTYINPIPWISDVRLS